jgi:hypothetical protein
MAFSWFPFFSRAAPCTVARGKLLLCALPVLSAAVFSPYRLRTSLLEHVQPCKGRKKNLACPRMVRTRANPAWCGACYCWCRLSSRSRPWVDFWDGGNPFAYRCAPGVCHMVRCPHCMAKEPIYRLEDGPARRGWMAGWDGSSGNHVLAVERPAIATDGPISRPAPGLASRRPQRLQSASSCQGHGDRQGVDAVVDCWNRDSQSN